MKKPERVIHADLQVYFIRVTKSTARTLTLINELSFMRRIDARGLAKLDQLDKELEDLSVLVEVLRDRMKTPENRTEDVT